MANKSKTNNKNINQATPPVDQNTQSATPVEQDIQQTPPVEQINQTNTPPVAQVPPAPAPAPAPAPQKPVTFKSLYAKHTLNFDGVPKIEFTPASSRDANEGGVFKTTNLRQINALRESDDFKRGIIKEVK